jgi:hypothetical protein
MSDNGLGRATLLLRWEPRVDSALTWGDRLSDWLTRCEEFDPRLVGWTTGKTGELVPHAARELAELLQRLGGMTYGGARVEGALSLRAHTEGAPVHAAVGFFASGDELDVASLDVPGHFLIERVPHDLPEVMAFVADSAAKLDARWAAWRFRAQVDALSSRESTRDHAGWITFYRGVTPRTLSRLQQPAVGLRAEGGVVVASVPTLGQETGESLAKAGRRVERDLFGRFGRRRTSSTVS